MNKSSQRSLWVLTTEYDPYIIGGLGTVATLLTRQLARNGVFTMVLSKNRYSRYDVARENNLLIIRFPKGVLAKLKPAQIHLWMRNRGYFNPKCIHIHSLQFTALAAYFRKKYSIPVIYTCHSLVALEVGPKSKKLNMIRKQVQLLKTANRIVVPSRWERAKLKALYPFCAQKIIVIRHGVSAFKSEVRGPRDHLLFVGRLIPSKGIEPLLKAIALLKKNNKKVRLHVIGDGKKHYVKRLKLLAKRLGIQSNVMWHGFRKQNQVQKMYRVNGAVVMPSMQGESFGLVALEALASGVPLISTRAGGLSEIVNSTVAQIIPRVESRTIASAIESMWRNPILTRKRVIAGQRLASRYRWSSVAVQYQKQFKLS